MLGLEAVQPRPLRAPSQLVTRLLGERCVMLGVPAADDVGIAVVLQALHGVVAERLEHPDSRLAVGALGHGDQAGVEQLAGPRQRIGARLPVAACQRHCREGVDAAASLEHARSPVDVLKVRRQQVITPGDGVPQRQMTRRAPGITGCQAKAVPEARQDRLGGQQLDPRRRARWPAAARQGAGRWPPPPPRSRT